MHRIGILAYVGTAIRQNVAILPSYLFGGFARCYQKLDCWKP